MASRPKGYGMTAELADKTASKYDPALAGEAVEWINAVLGEQKINIPNYDLGNVHEALKDGVALCLMIMKIEPSAKIKVNTSKMAFKQMENIGNFLQACENYGCTKTDLFQTVDLYENQNMPQVINAIHALGRKAQSKGFAGAHLGPKESNANVRHFSEEQMKAGQNVIGLQMGSNKGASQAGQNFGKTRAIID